MYLKMRSITSQNGFTSKEGFTLIPLIVIYIFIFLMVKDIIWEKPKLKSSDIEEYSGYEVTIEWKKGMKNSPETILSKDSLCFSVGIGLSPSAISNS